MSLSNRSSDRLIAREMTLKWLSGLLVLAALTLAGFWMFGRQVRALEASASLINEAGRQRMLSQRAALLAERLADPAAEALHEEIRAEILGIALTMEGTHSILLGGSAATGRPGDMPESLNRIFQESPHRLDERCREFVAAVSFLANRSQLDPEVLALVVDTAEEGSFLDALDAVVAELERHSKTSVARFKLALLAVTILALGVLMVLGLAVFRPMVENTRRILARLRQQAETQRLTLDSALTSIAAVDPTGRLVTANRFLCDLTDYKEAELLGRSFLSLIHSDERAVTGRLFRSIVKDEASPPPHEVRLVTKGGEVRRGLFRCGLQRDEQGTPVLAVIHFEDSTDRLEAEEDARQSRERLAHISRVTAMGEMAGGIAHEINQPLTAIAMYAQACRRLGESGRLRSDDLRTTLEKISQQAQRAGEVIRRLRNFVRQDNSGAQVVDLNDVVAEAVALTEGDARLHDCEIESHLSAGLEPVAADPIQLQQVIVNLIRNGIEAQAGNAGVGLVLVSTSAAGSDAVEVTVSDRGGGLPEEFEKLFEPFFTTKSSGLGMGLSISRTIIASHGGRLWCTSNPDGGAMFLFSLPTAVEGRRQMTG